MPFKSQRQRAFMFSQHPEIARRWEHETASAGTHLPPRADMKSKSDHPHTISANRRTIPKRTSAGAGTVPVRGKTDDDGDSKPKSKSNAKPMDAVGFASRFGKHNARKHAAAKVRSKLGSKSVVDSNDE